MSDPTLDDVLETSDSAIVDVLKKAPPGVAALLCGLDLIGRASGLAEAAAMISEAASIVADDERLSKDERELAAALLRTTGLAVLLRSQLLEKRARAAAAAAK